MRLKDARIFVGAIATCGALLLAFLFVSGGEVAPGAYRAALAVASLGLAAEILVYALPHGGSGSVATIPFLAAGLLAPGWGAAAAVGAVMAVTQIVHRRPLIKTVFNVAQATLAVGIGSIAYAVAGGKPFLQHSTAAGWDPTPLALSSAIIFALVFTAVNTGAVSGAIAIDSSQPFAKVWKENTLTTIVYLVFSIPAALLLAWTTTRFGLVGVWAIAIPLLGVRQLHKSTNGLRRVNEELLVLMVKSIEARDPYTSGHSQRVSRSSEIIARAIGLSPREIERVRIAGLLHDIGKIDASLGAIITKPGKLTNEEFAVMQTHPDKGAELVSTITHLQDLVPSIRHHHERWTGGGYPTGIAGERIPLGARIIAVADTIDAMMSDRAYRTRRTIEEIRDEIVRCRGTQFDPVLADCVVDPAVWDAICDGGPPVPGVSRRSSPRLAVVLGNAAVKVG